MNAITLNRRSVMLSAVAGASSLLLPSLGSPGDAKAQATGSPIGNIGHYRLNVGEIRATVLSDGIIGGPPRVYASNAPEAELEEVLRQAFLPTDHMTLNLNTLLIETGGRRILIEAGAGKTMGPNGGRIFDNLAAIGISTRSSSPTPIPITSEISGPQTVPRPFPAPQSSSRRQTGPSSSAAIPICPTCPCRGSSVCALRRTSRPVLSRS